MLIVIVAKQGGNNMKTILMQFRIRSIILGSENL